MPKVLIDVKQRILSCAKHKLFQEGYTALSLRSVAKECDVAVGTIYNYFENKDTLIAEIMLEDWIKSLHQMDVLCESASTLQEGAFGLIGVLKEFCTLYDFLFEQSQGTSAMNETRHSMLISQLNERMINLMTKMNREDLFDLSGLFSELLLLCAMRKTITHHQISQMLELIFKKG